jgi:protein-S-isoprenylcysteine O-methyltransferase
MTSVRILWLLLCLLWTGAEIKLARKNQIDYSNSSDSEEISQWVLWITVVTSLVLAVIFKTLGWAPIPIEYLPRQLFALLMFANGLFLRYSAVSKLGRFFTTNVLIQSQHELIVDGPYRWVRHPAYTGLLIALAAAGLAMGDIIAMLLLTVPTFFAFKFRIVIEEKLLNKKFGEEYRDYIRTTWKLLPWLF